MAERNCGDEPRRLHSVRAADGKQLLVCYAGQLARWRRAFHTRANELRSASECIFLPRQRADLQERRRVRVPAFRCTADVVAAALAPTVASLAAPPLQRNLRDPWVATNGGGFAGTWSQEVPAASYPVTLSLHHSLVTLGGSVHNSGSGSNMLNQTMLVLPVGYRPRLNKFIPCNVNKVYGECVVQNDGAVIFRNAALVKPEWVSLDEIAVFVAEADAA